MNGVGSNLEDIGFVIVVKVNGLMEWNIMWKILLRECVVMFVAIYVCVCIDIYIYINAHTHTYTYTYTYTRTHTHTHTPTHMP